MATRGPRGRPAPLGLALGASVLGLAVAFALKEPCTTHAWSNSFQYRHLCYNDIQPLFYVRKVNEGLVPYKDVQVEYPVIIGMFMYGVGRLLALISHTFAGGGLGSFSDPSYFVLTALLLAPFSVAVTLLLRPRVTAARLMIWAVGTPTLFYSFLNWDLIAVALMVWGLVEVERRRWEAAGVAFGLGFSAKLFPLFLLPGSFLSAVDRGDRKAAVGIVAWAAAALAAVNLPWMIWAWSGWLGVWKFHQQRFPDFGTVWYWLSHLGNSIHPSPWWNNVAGGYGGVVGVGGEVVFALLTFAILWVGWKRRAPAGGYPVAATGLAIVASFMVLWKVHSPQYALWVTPLLAMVDIPWWQVFAYLGADAILFVSGFWWYTVPNPFSPPAPVWEEIFVAAVFLRAGALILIALTAARTGRRELASDESVEPAGVEPAVVAGA